MGLIEGDETWDIFFARHCILMPSAEKFACVSDGPIPVEQPEKRIAVVDASTKENIGEHRRT